MIPKQLFFIWVGDNKPNYVDFSVKTFKEVNPDFKVDLLEWKIDRINNINFNNLENEYDKCLFNCINNIINNDRYQISIERYKRKKRKFCQILVNILRMDILSKFGGIYLDCDTFPNKPFDDKLLNRKHFSAYAYLRYDYYNRHKDCFFLGSEGNNFYYDNYVQFKDNINVTNFGDEKNIKWLNKQKMFFECKLNYIFDINANYIEHFVDYTWNPDNCKTPICKYDKCLYM